MVKLKRTLIAACTAALFSSLAQASDMGDTVSAFQADQRAISNFYRVHEKASFYQRELALLQDWQAKLEGLSFDEMDQEAKVDYLLLNAKVKDLLISTKNAYKGYQDVAAVANFASPLYAFIDARRRGARPDAKQLAADFADAVQAINSQKEKQEKSPYSDWQKADKAAKVILDLKSGLEEAIHFYNDYDPQFTWWMETPINDLISNLDSYATFLADNYTSDTTKDDGSGIIGNPIGKQALIDQLRASFIAYDPEDLIDIAKEQFDWCKEQMIQASREMGYGDDWKAALEAVKDTYVPPGEQPKTINDLLEHSVKFVEDRDLITLPPLAKETWRMIMMTPERQKVNPFFTGGRNISISYPTEGMTHADKLMSMRGNNPNFSYPTVQHELLPGHNLQFFMNQRHKPYREAFRNPFWTEGWALYWEIILWDKDFATTPEQKMGMLFWRIHRCARIMFSLQYHLGEITPQQAIDMLVNEVGHEYANAEAEVRRSFATNYVPLYQLAYMIGGLQFNALRNEMLAKGWTEKQFHDRVMQENTMPIEVLRLLIQEKDFDRDYETQWRFSTSFTSDDK